MFNETPITFNCESDRLHGIIHRTEKESPRGVLVIVGGPQTRVGSHRQFVLLARALASAGIPVMRFDYRGIGDADGEQRTFQDIDTDIRCAVDTFMQQCNGLREIIVWGLCDGASAAMFYAHTDDRIRGLVLLNPDTLTVTSTAKTYLKHYYLQRIVDPELWKKILSGSFNFRESVSSLLSMVNKVLPSATHTETADVDERALPFPQRMLNSLEKYRYPLVLILSGNDMTADAFKDCIREEPRWNAIFQRPQASRLDLAESDHTFSSRKWRKQVEDWTLDWIRQLPPV